MKQRFSSLDVKFEVIAHELSSTLCTLRLVNVYDLSSRIFLVKFAKPDQRESLVIDSGFRCHLTEFTRTTAAVPSAFVTRLRKFLKTRRVTAVSQIGTDRIIEIQFSDGQYRLLLEFYAGGNIVLTDRDLNIISLLRIVTEEQEQLRVGLKYSLENRQNYNGVPVLTSARLSTGLQKAISKVDGEVTAHQKNLKSRPGDTLRKALANALSEFPPILIDHALRAAAFDPVPSPEDILKDLSLRERLVIGLGEAQRIVDGLTTSIKCKGYIIAKPAKNISTALPDPAPNDGTASERSLMYDDFHPFRPQQYEERPEITMLKFDGFNRTVDEYFSSIESQKLESRLTEREENAKRKLERAKLDHQKRLGGLQQVQELNIRKAQAIEANLPRVQEATTAVNTLVSQGMDWQEIERLIGMEQERHNVVADIIRLPLKLDENTITLLLSEADHEDVDDFDGNESESNVLESQDAPQTSSKAADLPKPADKHLAVDIDLALSSWSNARQYYEQKKYAAAKERKTLQSSGKALKSTESKIDAELKKGLKQEKEIMHPQRKTLWFEKFAHFISTEGYLVLGGKDNQQSEMLYKTYLKKGDKYVHADLHGAATVVVKNKLGTSERPIPPSTLSQAGTLAVATSSAWDSKAVIAAWWVDANQVSKTTPTGEILPNGSFVIQGQKHFLPPAQLLLGFGIMFRVSEESKKRRLRHRIQDPVDLSPSELPKDMEKNEDKQNCVDGAESQTKISDVETGHSQSQELRHKTNINEAEIYDGDDNENDDSSDSMRGNPLQPFGGCSNAIHSQHEVGDNLASDLGTERTKRNEAQSRESGDGDTESEQQGQTPSSEQSYTDTNESRQLSAKERSLLGKNSSGGAAFPNTDSESNVTPAQLSSTSVQPDKKHGSPQVRGKHGKYQKLKSKYAGQDEEDRALSMHLLGSAAAQEKATKAAAAKADKEKELAAQKERRREQHALAAEKSKKAEELRKLHFEADPKALDDVELEGLDDLDAFVGNPLPGDEILDALVVCGPWDAIGGRYKWRVKLQPGTMKKGKAVREILGNWNDVVTQREKAKRLSNGQGDDAILQEEILEMRERELIRAIRESEVIGAVPVGKVRVVMGQGGAGDRGRGGGGAGKGGRWGRGIKKQN